MTNSSNNATPVESPKPPKDFLIVGIGASAGGIKALKAFFENTSADSAMAYVVILHLSPEHESHLAGILQKVTAMQVAQIKDERVLVEPNRVYVIPPNKSLKMDDGHLQTSPILSYEERRAPVDIFFRTLAESHCERAVAVILSGTGANGSMGIKRVKERGGIVIVQDPNEAEYGDMPRNSLDTDLVDFILPVAQIPPRIVSYKENLQTIDLPLEVVEKPDADESALRRIFVELRQKTGQDFSNYKRATVLRRVERRLNVRQLRNMTAYANFLHDKPDEAQFLLKDLLISVTNFFRDRAAFEVLEQKVLPQILDGKTSSDTVRIWVAGCATGEEAYSLAMLCAEKTTVMDDAPRVQIFATDLDTEAIAAAREGLYTNSDVADVSDERLRRFFAREGDLFRVRRELRETILFARHNLIKDPPFLQLDLATCRNLLIYLNHTAQTRVMETLHFALKPGGFMFLGSAETPDGSSDLYQTVDHEKSIYRSRATVLRPLSSVMETGPIFALTEQPTRLAATTTAAEKRVLERMSLAALHQQLLELYAPPSILVNENYDLVHLSERAGRFLQITGGEPSNNLLKMARPSLRLELRSALYQAQQQRHNVEARNVIVNTNDGDENINIIVRPVNTGEATGQGYLLVIFAPAQPDEKARDNEQVAQSIEPIARQLEEELMRTRAQLRTTTEQYEVQAEELKASNEELQAINEELRSAAEELETGKEELQSVNEELSTVNQELKIKIEELSQANNDFQNFINASGVGTVFLDRAFRLKLFTPAAREVFNLIPSDVDRSLFDINSNFDDAALQTDLATVLQTLQTIEREIVTRDRQTYLAKFSPYRTEEDRIDGVIITFIKITEIKRAESDLRESYERTSEILESVNDYFYAVDQDFNFTYINKKAEELLGRSRESLIGRNCWTEFPQAVGGESYHKHLAAMREKRPLQYETVSQLSDQWIDVSIYPNASGGLSVYFRNIGERKKSEENLRLSEERLRQYIDGITEYAIITTDDDGLITNWNTGAVNVFGYSAAEAVGRHTEILFTPEDRANGEAQKELRQARENGRAADERWHVRKDNSRFYASGVLSVLRDSNGDGGFIKVTRDLTGQKQAEDELRRARHELERRVQERTEELAQANERLQAEIIEHEAVQEERIELLRQLVTTQEDERRRIARDIHDQLGQEMTALRLKLQTLRQDCAYEDLCRQIDETQTLAARLDSEIDFLAWELRPAALDDLGLVSALGNYVEEWGRHFNIAAEFQSLNMDKIRLAPAVEINFYRITQEALNNVSKHALAKRVTVLLERNGDFAILIIEDDGIGFEVKQAAKPRENGRGLGLIGMRERTAIIGGTLEIESAPERGTTIFVRVPIATIQNQSETRTK